MALADITKSTGKKVDVYASDACLMQMASVIYELKDKTDVVVGSEEIDPGYGFPYDTILQALNSDPGMGAEGLGKVVVQKFHDFYYPYQGLVLRGNQGTTISAVRTSELRGFVRLLNAWVKEAEKPENAAAVMEAVLSTGTLSFEYGYDGVDSAYSPRSKDLSDFISQVNADSKTTLGLITKPSPTLKAMGQVLQDVISQKLVIISTTTGPDRAYERAKGVAIYFPQMIYDPSYDETKFAADSLWDDFIKEMLKRRQK
jgi:hypothetical protein